MQNPKRKTKYSKKGKTNKLIIAGIILAALVILTLPATSRFTANMMYELARNRQKSRSKNLSGIEKAMQIYGNDSYQYVPPNIQITCSSNLSGLMKAIRIYLDDYDGYPTPEKWCDLLIEKCKVDPKIFRCPGAKKGPCNYALNKNIFEFREIDDPDIVMIFETQPGWNQVGGPEILTTENHSGQGCNVVFIDSQVEFVRSEDIDKLKWKPDDEIESGNNDIELSSDPDVLGLTK